MIVAWRIVRAKRARTAFDGEGAAKFGGRWNSRGTRIVYASSTVALAALETLAHLNPLKSFAYKLFKIEFDEKLVERLERLPTGWRREPPGLGSQRIGDVWVKTMRTPLLAVPSVLVPQEMNYLLNPAHPRYSEIHIGRAINFRFDPRLLA